MTIFKKHIKSQPHWVNILLLCALFAVSCKIDEPSLTNGGGTPVNLSMTVSMEEILSALENGGPTTKGPYEDAIARINTDEITSFVLYLIKVNQEDLNSSMLVGYRVFALPKSDGHRYFYYNEGGGSLPFTAIEGIYSEDKDDSNYDQTIYGVNTISADRKKVTVNFFYDSPMHGPVEKLTAGQYLVCVLANYDESTQTVFQHRVGDHVRAITGWWQHYQNTTGFSGAQKHAIPDPNSPTGRFRGYHQFLEGRLVLGDGAVQYWYDNDYHTEPQTNTLGEALHNDENDRITSASYIRDKGQKILTSYAGYLQLTSEDNNVNLSLKRDVGRITVTLNNESSIPITVTNLSFSDNVAAAASFLFERGVENGTSISPIIFPTQWMGAPVVTSQRAIIPFVPNTQFTSPDESKILFDALVLPNRDVDNQMSLTMDLSIPSKGINHTETIPLTYFRRYEGVELPIHEIKRNQQLNIHINVRYNETTQEFQFEVKDWYDSENRVIFD